jgi:hypothetical protein
MLLLAAALRDCVIGEWAIALVIGQLGDLHADLPTERLISAS